MLSKLIGPDSFPECLLEWEGRVRELEGGLVADRVHLTPVRCRAKNQLDIDKKIQKPTMNSLRLSGHHCLEEGAF